MRVPAGDEPTLMFEPVVLSPKIVVRAARRTGSVASTFILGTGQGKATLGAWV